MKTPAAPAGRAGFANVNGTRLWRQDAGAGPPLVLVHGSPLDARMWDAQVAAFAPTSRVIRYDLRGYGQSAPPTDLPYRHEDDLAALLDHLGVARAAILGLSMGGRVAVDFALAYPARVTALVLAGSTISGFPWTEDLPALDAEVRDAVAGGGLPAAREIVAARHWFQPAQRVDEVRQECLRQIADYAGWHWLHEDPVIAPHPPAFARLEDLAAPTLVIVGDHDHRDVRAVAAALAARAPGAALVTLPDVAHMVNLEAPATFNALALGFLARHAPAT